MLGLKKAALGRLGDDARDDEGNTYELKTVNLVDTRGAAKTSYPGVTTEHTLRKENSTRYRATKAWLIGVFKGNVPLDVYIVRTSTLEPFFKKWEAAIAKAGNHESNNPKLPFGFVVEKGTKYVVPGSDGVPRPPVGKYTHPATSPAPKANPGRR
jgi:hypothetical protein